MSEPGGGAGAVVAIVRKFLSAHLSVMFMVLALCLGLTAVVVTPREEDPQIIVPMADVIVEAPGCPAAEVENLVTVPLERILWQIDGVEHVYSVSRRDASLVTVRFYVGEDREDSLAKLAARIAMHHDIVPPVVTRWVVKPVSIDDVPIVTVTLVSRRRDPGELRRIAEEVKARLDSIEDLSATEIVGGYPREVRVTPDPEELRGRGLSLADVATALARANVGVTAGSIRRDRRQLALVARTGLMSVEDVRRLVVSSSDQKPVYLSDVARVEDVPTEPESSVRFSAGPACGDASLADVRGLPCVTLAFAKKRGTNAVDVARTVLERIDALKGTMIPDDVSVVVTRNSGLTADRKVNELLGSLAFAVLTVVAVLLLTMGWREALIVALAVPISFSLALFVNVLAGYTINRVTLFALILSLGLVVDDPITNVDNIQRHMRMGLEPPRDAVLNAVREVLPPVIMSTLAIIVSFLPMFFITGMMGPYMRPMAVNVPVTVLFSTVSALTFVPWLGYLLLRRK
ncbi:MAG TPA: efflux RND transporter permease subunit, partial [Planctomycetota bacterium]|nr:efflux RND transporter permease subunit [Planctomycetota bacterium]